MFNVKLKPVVLAVAGVLAATSVSYAADAIKAEKVEVISTSPLPGVGQSIDKMSSTVQVVSGKDIERSQSLDLTEYMNRNLAGVNINENQGNPLQPDVNYRGFTASPLLGTPQGLSVYMDGVRMNQPFGDVVSWDLIPRNAISSMQLYSGSNPVFGLNTLGGAISVQTKDGRNNQGGSIQLTTGSFGRKIGEFEYGGVSKDNSVDYFVAGTWFNEEGYRDHSPSDNKQLFTKLGWQGEATSLKLTYAYAESDLNGNGMAPSSTVAANRDKVYTWPDNTGTKSHFTNLNWDHLFNDDLIASGNVYYRNIKTHTLNGDANGGSAPSIDSTPAQLLGQQIYYTRPYSSIPADWRNTSNVNAAGYSYNYATYTGTGNNINDQNLVARCAATVTSYGAEPSEKCTGAVNRGFIDQENYGFANQLSGKFNLGGLANNYVAGFALDYSTSKYQFSSEYGTLMSDGSVTGSGFFAEPNQYNYVRNGAAIDDRVNLKGRQVTGSIYATDTVDLTDKLALTVAGRYNYTDTKNSDQIGDDLNGHFHYQRFNPALGLAFNPTQTLNFYGGYSESSRTPTSIELGCADSGNPCKLPNAMASDPYLEQVVSRSWEGGLRAKLTPDLAVNASVFDTRNSNDILFVGTTTSGDGYFKNFGETERKGFNLGFNETFGNLSLIGNYTYLEATFESASTVNSAANNSPNAVTVCSSSSATGCAPSGSIQVGSDYFYTSAMGNAMVYSNNNEYTKVIDIKKGNRIPLIPRNMLKLAAFYKVNDKFTLGVDTLTVSSSLMRGNENNEDTRGALAGYTNVNLTAAYSIDSEWTVFAKVNNLFDKEFATAGSLGMNVLNPDGTPRTGSSRIATSSGQQYLSTYAYSVSEAFVTPGAPLAAWVGVRYSFGGKKPSSVDRD
jgi:outer membrane receptor protein involved in Fe transport